MVPDGHPNEGTSRGRRAAVYRRTISTRRGCRSRSLLFGEEEFASYCNGAWRSWVSKAAGEASASPSRSANARELIARELGFE